MDRTIEVAFRQEEVSDGDLAGRQVVLIDVLRVTSTLTTELAAGAEEIRCYTTVREAFRAGKRWAHRAPLLCGERNGSKVRGFDLGNSPRDFSPEMVRGRMLIVTSTNGTRALKRTGRAGRVLLGCFLNLSAVAKEVARRSEPVVMLCAGTRGERSEEDVACAGGVATLLQTKGWRPGDTAGEAIRSWHGFRRAPVTFLRGTLGAVDLIELGLDRDIRDCARRDGCDLVPAVTATGDGWLVTPVSRAAT